MSNEYFSKSSKPDIKIKHEGFFLKSCLGQLISFFILIFIIFFLIKACDAAENKSGKNIMETIGHETRKVYNEFDKGWNSLDSFKIDTISRKIDTLKIK